MAKSGKPHLKVQMISKGLTMGKHIILFTFQKPDHDITVLHDPLPDYSDDNGAFHDIAKYLGWESWVWCFTSLADWHEEVTDEWLSVELLCGSTLWVLRPPMAAIRWCALEAQCENRLPIHAWFEDAPEQIRRLGDIPMALVRTPIDPGWVIGSRWKDQQ